VEFKWDLSRAPRSAAPYSQNRGAVWPISPHCIGPEALRARLMKRPKCGLTAQHGPEMAQFILDVGDALDRAGDLGPKQLLKTLVNEITVDIDEASREASSSVIWSQVRS